MNIISFIKKLTPIKKTSFQVYRQMDQMDCGPTCLRMISAHYGKIYSKEYLHEKCSITREGVSLSGISEAAEIIGMKTLAVRLNYETLKKDVPLPCIAHWRQRHFIVVVSIEHDKVVIADPAYGIINYTKDEFINGWVNSSKDKKDNKGLLLLLETTPIFYEKENINDDKKIGLGFLFPYIKPYKKLVFQLVIGLTMGTMILMSFPFLTQALVDYGISYQKIDFVYLLLMGQIMLFFSQTAVDMLRSWILLHISSRVNISIISDFLMKLMKLPISFFDTKMIGDILQRIQDHRRVESFLSATTLNVMFSLLNFIVFGAILAYYSLNIFTIFLVGTSLYVAWVLKFMKRRALLEYKRFDQASGNQSSMIQLINGMQEIKLNSSERRRRWEWEQIQVSLHKISIKALSLLQYQTSGGNFVNELKNIIITFIAAKSVIDGDLTLGMMLSVQYIIGQLNSPIANFVTFIQSMQDAKISLERLSEIHLIDNEEEDSDDKIKSIPANKTITINGDLNFRYGNQSSALVLSDLNLEIPQGKITAIVGASGSGKTTLLKLLLKFYNPTSGIIKCGNINLDNISTSSWRKKCGAVMQGGYIFADTIARNITESDSEEYIDRTRLHNAIKIANLEEMIESLPLGFNTRVGSSGISLSGGQNQRLLIARAVYKNPDFLFFDEATSSLDASNERIIMNNLQEFYTGKTVLVIAHRLSTVRNADQIIVLDKGRIVESGHHELLTKNKGAYFTLVKNQLELGS